MARDPDLAMMEPLGVVFRFLVERWFWSLHGLLADVCN
jgi:hypothetical protein